MTKRINAAWHKANRMPEGATLDQRVAWHLAHRKVCACRTDLPAGIAAELKRRGVKAPPPLKAWSSFTFTKVEGRPRSRPIKKRSRALARSIDPRPFPHGPIGR